MSRRGPDEAGKLGKVLEYFCQQPRCLVEIEA